MFQRDLQSFQSGKVLTTPHAHNLFPGHIEILTVNPFELKLLIFLLGDVFNQLNFQLNTILLCLSTNYDLIVNLKKSNGFSRDRWLVSRIFLNFASDEKMASIYVIYYFNSTSEDAPKLCINLCWYDVFHD